MSRKDELVQRALDLAEKRIREGTASSKETAEFLRLGTNRDELGGN